MRKLFVILVLGFFVIGGLLSSSWAATAKGPFKVGWLSPLTGLWAETGRDMTNGLELYLDQIGHKMAGRQVILVSEDDRATPETAVTKLRKLVSHDRVAVAAGTVAANTGLAIAAASDELQTPVVVVCAAADDITQRMAKKWTTRIGWTGSQSMYPFGEWAYRNGYKKIAALSTDFQFGYDTLAGFQRTFEEAGGQIVQKVWVPINVIDLGPYIANLRKDVDAIWICVVGGAALKFPKQYKDMGMTLPLLGTGQVSDENVLPAQGDEIIGFISPLQYTASIESPANRKFQEAYQKKYKKIGSYMASHSYEFGMWLHQAVDAVKGDVENKEAFLKAIKAVKLQEPPRGSFYMDDYGNPVQTFYIRKVEKVKGFPLDFLGGEAKKWNIVIAKIPAVSQFWKYDPKEYMKQPVFTQNYPSCKFCQ